MTTYLLDDYGSYDSLSLSTNGWFINKVLILHAWSRKAFESFPLLKFSGNWMLLNW